MRKIAFELNNEKQAREFLETVGKITQYVWSGSQDSPCAEDADAYFTHYPVWIIFRDDMLITWCDDETCVDGMLIADDEGTLFGLLDICDEYDVVNHPAHYTQGKVECIDAMEQVFGRDAVIAFAVLNTWKYLWRRKDKDNEEQDIQKAIRYFDIAKELINR